MNELTLIALVVVLFIFLWSFWYQQPNHDIDTQTDDERLTPLLRGINYLLNDDPEHALQELLQVARMRTETAEVYLALGDMFRNKGEIGRAIRIHQSLLARPDLASRLILETSLALAKDYQSAGFLDRAIQQYQKVLHTQWNHLFALQASLRIYEQTANWQKAMACLALLAQVEKKDMSLHLAYLTVEDAHLAKTSQNKINGIHAAIQINPTCQHAWICLIQIALNLKHHQLAQQHVLSFLKYVPHGTALVPIFFPNAVNELHEALLQCWQDTKSETLALNWMEAVKEKSGEKHMLDLRDQLKFEPNGLATHLRYIALHSSNTSLQQQTQAWKKKATNYHCHTCGIRVLTMRWQCPQCHQWGTIESLLNEV